MHKVTRGTQVKGTKRMKTQLALLCAYTKMSPSDTNGCGCMRMLADRALYDWLDVFVCVCVCVCDFYVCERERERERERKRQRERAREREREKERERERVCVCAFTYVES